MATGIIYVITNLVNGKYYVGQTTSTLRARWTQHVSDAKNREGHMYFHRAIRKYGSDAFAVEAVASADSADALNALECSWVIATASYRPETGYNRTYGGDNGVTQEVRERIRQTLTGRKLSPEHRASIRLATRGKSHAALSVESRAKISASLTGKVRTEESRARQSASSKGKHGAPKSLAHRLALSMANKGKTLSAETRAKLSVALTGRLVSKETRDKLSAAFRGRIISQEQRSAISAARIGIKLSTETRAKMSASRTGKPLSAEHRQAIIDGKRAARDSKQKENAWAA